MSCNIARQTEDQKEKQAEHMKNGEQNLNTTKLGNVIKIS